VEKQHWSQKRVRTKIKYIGVESLEFLASICFRISYINRRITCIMSFCLPSDSIYMTHLANLCDNGVEKSLGNDKQSVRPEDADEDLYHHRFEARYPHGQVHINDRIIINLKESDIRSITRRRWHWHDANQYGLTAFSSSKSSPTMYEFLIFE
jgi:hypothetical protein